MAAPGQPAPPEVRQNQDPTHHLFGAVAVPGAGPVSGMWGVMDPEQGGHWATADEVADWSVIFRPPEVAAEPEAKPEPAKRARSRT
jgi:hypothetical protein